MTTDDDDRTRNNKDNDNNDNNDNDNNNDNNNNKEEKEKEQAIVSCGTSAGPIVMQFTRQWSPIGYDRVVELFERSFYDHSHFFRVAQHYLVQFGISYSDDTELQSFARRSVEDDPQQDPPIAFDTGMISFAGSGPNSRSSQIFIAYGPNKGLGRELWETPVGRVISGMEHAAKFYSYGDMPPWGKGPVQNKIHRGREYIDTEFPLTDSFATCTVQRSRVGVDNSRAAEVQAAVADARMEAELAEAALSASAAAAAAAAAHGGISAEQDEHAQFQRAEQQLGDGASIGGITVGGGGGGGGAGHNTPPISLSGMKQAADKMRHFHRDGNGDWSEAALFLACIVLGCAVAGWITTKLFGRSKKADKTS